MSSEIKDKNTDLVVAVVGQYVIVDGFYSRSGETTVRGSVDENNAAWSQQLTSELKQRGYAAKTHQNGPVVYISVFPLREPFPWIHVLLFLATYVTVSFAPAVWNGEYSVFYDIHRFLRWQQFSVPLLSILVFHEFGHYWAARWRGIRVSLPYFIPAPTGIGTFGAFIKSNSPFPSRRDLLEVGAYGPIAGFAVALVVLVIGVAHLTYQAVPPGIETRSLIDPLIVRLVEFLAWKSQVPDGYGLLLQDNPLIFAAWVGLAVTAINLLPVGQLDGGHIIYALFPRAHYWVSRGMFALLLIMGYFWLGWLIFGFLVFFVIKFHHQPTLNDYQPLDRKSKWIGWTAIAIFILTFSPMPF